MKSSFFFIRPFDYGEKKNKQTHQIQKKIQVHKKVTGMLMFSLTFLYTTSLVFFFGVFIISRFWQCYPRR